MTHLLNTKQCGTSNIVGLGGKEREARMGESLGWRGKEEDGGEMREKESIN
jgi:hypothetical protein